MDLDDIADLPKLPTTPSGSSRSLVFPSTTNTIFGGQSNLADRWKSNATPTANEGSSDTVRATRSNMTMKERLELNRQVTAAQVYQDLENIVIVQRQKWRRQRSQDLWNKEKDKYIASGKPSKLRDSILGKPVQDILCIDSDPAQSNPQKYRDPVIQFEHVKATDIVAHLRVIQNSQDGNLNNLVSKLMSMAESVPRKTFADAGYVTMYKHLSLLVSRKVKSSMDQTLAALVHLSVQLRQVIFDRCARSVTTGNNATFVEQCLLYVTELGFTGPDATWPALYFALRCSDAATVLEMWQNLVDLDVSVNVKSAVYQVLTSLAQHQQDKATFWDKGVPIIDSNDVRVLEDFVEGLNDNDDEYMVGFFSLLTGTIPLNITDTTVGMSTTEDYMLSALWIVAMSDDTTKALEDLGSIIEGWNAEDMNDSESEGWSLAHPLFLSQRYTSALIHLTNSAGSRSTLQAVHVALVLAAAGLTLKSDGITVIDDLLVTYAQYLVTRPEAGPIAAVEYLARVPDTERARTEIASLIAKADLVLVLGGTLNADGIRGSKTILDKYYSAEDISFILNKAAGILSLSKERSKQSHALLCCMLVGNYISVLNLFNNLLCPPNEASPDKRFWVDQAQLFFKQFIDRRTRVMLTLEAQDQLRLLNTTRTLIELHTFFALCKSERYGEALSLVDSLNLLPQSQDEVAVKENEYYKLDTCLKQAYPDVLVASTQALYQQFQRTKQEHANNLTVARQRLDVLKERAKLISLLASSVNMNKVQSDALTRLQTLMVY